MLFASLGMVVLFVVRSHNGLSASDVSAIDQDVMSINSQAALAFRDGYGRHHSSAVVSRALLAALIFFVSRLAALCSAVDYCVPRLVCLCFCLACNHAGPSDVAAFCHEDPGRGTGVGFAEVHRGGHDVHAGEA